MIRVLIAFLSLIFVTTGCITTKPENEITQCFVKIKNIDKDKGLYLLTTLTVTTNEAGNHDILYAPKLIIQYNRSGMTRSYIEFESDQKDKTESGFTAEISTIANEYAEANIRSKYKDPWAKNKFNYLEYKGLLELNKVFKVYETPSKGMKDLKLSENDKFVIDNLK
ncbi:hypothetical protein AAEX28_12510 [Lentisphaerota bacterium WC36G]|nr:hypothetical protein LJT99_15335 [Lentisphaerae bacterium WC36]